MKKTKKKTGSPASRRPSAATIWTIGHSNHPLEHLLDLLSRHQIVVLVDVRSSPYSGYATHFNREVIQRPLRTRGVEYVFLGDLLGGRAEGEQFYDQDGHVRYDRVARTPGFQHGIEQLFGGIEARRTALMCSEEDPAHCHRRLLVGRVLRAGGVRSNTFTDHSRRQQTANPIGFAPS